MIGSLIVVKLGGTEGVDFSAICNDAAELLKRGRQLVFVHGGSTEANSLGESLGTPPKMITSPSGYTSRYTDRKTLEIFLMAVNGKVNSLLTEQLQMLGVNAFGLCGLDGKLIQATRKDAIQSIDAERGKRKKTGRYGVVGGGRRLEALQLLHEQGKIPADVLVRCLEVSEDEAIAASLADNEREPLHPAPPLAQPPTV